MNNPELPKCNQDVFDHGYVYGTVDMPKHEAEEFCKEKSAETGNQFDWHHSGGRVVIKCLTKEKAAELLAARTMTEELPKLKRKLEESYRSMTTAVHFLKHCDDKASAIDELEIAIEKAGET